MGIVSQEWQNHFSLNVVYLFEIQGVLKNVISDLSVAEGDLIEISYTPDMSFYRYGKDFVKFKESEGIWLLDVNSKGSFRLSEHPAYRADIHDEALLRRQGAFAPVDVDGEEKSYNLAEWGNLTYSFRYAIAGEPERYPEHWPKTKGEAVGFMMESIDRDRLMSVYPESVRYFLLSETFAEIGLPRRGLENVNKELLRDLGRVDLSDARQLLLEEFQHKYYTDEQLSYQYKSGELMQPSVRRNRILNYLRSLQIPLGQSKRPSFLSFDKLVEELEREYNEKYANKGQIKIQIHEDFSDNTYNTTWHGESVSALRLIESTVKSVSAPEGHRYGFFIDLDTPSINNVLIRVECLPLDSFQIDKNKNEN